MLEPEAGRRDKRLVAVLLEEHPLKNQSKLFPIIGQVAGAPCQVGKDRIGFGKNKAVVVEHGRAPVRIDFEKLGRAAFAFQDVDFDDLAWDCEMSE